MRNGQAAENDKEGAQQPPEPKAPEPKAEVKKVAPKPEENLPETFELPAGVKLVEQAYAQQAQLMKQSNIELMSLPPVKPVCFVQFRRWKNFKITLVSERVSKTEFGEIAENPIEVKFDENGEAWTQNPFVIERMRKHKRFFDMAKFNEAANEYGKVLEEYNATRSEEKREQLQEQLDKWEAIKSRHTPFAEGFYEAEQKSLAQLQKEHDQIAKAEFEAQQKRREIAEMSQAANMSVARRVIAQ